MLAEAASEGLSRVVFALATAVAMEQEVLGAGPGGFAVDAEWAWELEEVHVQDCTDLLLKSLRIPHQSPVLQAVLCAGELTHCRLASPGVLVLRDASILHLATWNYQTRHNCCSSVVVAVFVAVATVVVVGKNSPLVAAQDSFDAEAAVAAAVAEGELTAGVQPMTLRQMNSQVA